MNQTLTDDLELTDLAPTAGCEFKHGNPVLCPVCAEHAAYRVLTGCTGAPVNWCVNVYQWYLRIVRDGVRCSDCRKTVADCWTVFPI